MANILFPTVSIPSLSRPKQNTDVRYKRAPMWDIEAGDFVRDGAGKILTDIGRDAYVVWCIKTSQTERFAKLAYPSAIGAELETAKQEKSQEAVELALERTIREALMVNPRTEYVRDFDFVWDGDQVHVTFTVKGQNIEEFQLST
ncbi:MAG: DUF2634 domain-containing protein [Oscillibacter sp.]|nr:DUF2634 domain-containing protein [Oscillibacter sp.]